MSIINIFRLILINLNLIIKLSLVINNITRIIRMSIKEISNKVLFFEIKTIKVWMQARQGYCRSRDSQRWQMWDNMRQLFWTNTYWFIAPNIGVQSNFII